MNLTDTSVRRCCNEEAPGSAHVLLPVRFSHKEPCDSSLPQAAAKVNEVCTFIKENPHPTRIHNSMSNTILVYLIHVLDICKANSDEVLKSAADTFHFS